MLALQAQLNLPGLDHEGPDELRRLMRVFGVLFAAGFFLGVLGHLFDSRALRAVGIALVLLGTAAFVMAVGSYG